MSPATIHAITKKLKAVADYLEVVFRHFSKGFSLQERRQVS
jgi:hypothetical protein